MSKLKVKLNRAGVRELMKDSGVVGVCQDEMGKRAASAGEGYVMERIEHPTRTGYALRAETPAAIHDNFENNTLLKLINGGNG